MPHYIFILLSLRFNYLGLFSFLGVKMIELNDGVYSSMHGFGTEADPESHLRYAPSYIQQYELNELYRGSWIAKRIIHLIPEESLKNGRNLEIENHKEYEKIEKRLRIFDIVAQAWAIARLSGNAFIVLRQNGDVLNTPINLAGDIAKFDILSKDQISIVYQKDQSNNTITEIDYYKFQKDGIGLKIHPSRVIPIYPDDTFALSPVQENRSELHDAAIAIYRYEILQKVTLASSKDFGLIVYHSSQLATRIATEGEDKIYSAYRKINRMKSALQGFVLDSEDKVTQLGATLSQLATPIEIVTDDICGITEVPKTLLFGIQQKGLGNNNDSQLKQFYEKCQRERERYIHPVFERLDEIISAIYFNGIEIDFDFKPILKPTEKEKAEVKKINAEADKIYLEAGLPTTVVTKELQESGTYNLSPDDVAQVSSIKWDQIDATSNNQTSNSQQQPITKQV